MIRELAGLAVAALTAVAAAPGAQAAPLVRKPVLIPPAFTPAAVPVGDYACYAGGQDLSVQLIIRGPRAYADGEGSSGAYAYTREAGALSFTSGPFAGAYARMFDARTIGMSDRGSSRLYIRCRR